MTNPRVVVVITVFAMLVLVGCESHGPGLAVRDRRVLEKHGRAVFGRPITLPLADLLMFPFAIETDQEQSKWSIGSVSGGSILVSGSSAWGSSGSSSEYFGGDRLSWNNVAFYDPRSGKSRLLLNEPALICAFYSHDEKHGPVYGDYLLFGIATADSNRDGVISAEDAVRLYRTAGDGAGLTPITAADTQLMDIRGIGGMLYVRVVHDADHDGKFTAKDPIQLLRVDPGTWAPPIVILPDELRKQAFDAATHSAK